ncbi:AtzH-like domain-containing protein [Mycolicibacterium sp. P9-22]|uniref:AtzH-like domain-containing protein n=1 Tax=Mycolicibacterium sp. P9-22 TaxID=2024613 RepID=UPI0011EF548D|nr:AtzH-like domain-containing protein [Mycolicibacterium sp. P9-22]KAA0120319.1 DUF3225 domain-containing protein [Mycolicibacterium sp. P9-22]
MATAARVVSSDAVPESLLNAFWAYDTALLANDTARLMNLFAPGPDTLRGDGRTLLVGHDEISAFRSARSRVPTRHVHEVHVRMLGEDTALTLAPTRDGAARGMQTQLWERRDGHWRILAAHVTNAAVAPQAVRPEACDPRIWRIVGTPLARHRADGPLSGHTFAAKDLFAVQGQSRGAGNPTYLAQQHPEPRHAAAVSALLDAGADLVGIAHTDEFAFGIGGTNVHYGTPPNPAAPGRTSGGSSSGPASAVALGHVTVGLGTDTAGSVRVPASYQGLFGLRTTHGALDTDGLLALAPSFDTIGWITRTLDDLHAVATALLPPAAPDHPPTRTAIIAHSLTYVDADIRDAFTATVSDLVARGAIPEPTFFDIAPSTLEQWFTAFRVVQAYEAWREHGTWLAANPDAVAADVTQRFAAGAAVTKSELSTALAAVAEARATLRNILSDTAILMPSTSGPAPDVTATGDEFDAIRSNTLRLTTLAALAGAPAISMPLLHDATGRPVGLSVVLAPGADLGLLRYARRLQPTNL